MIRGVTSVGLAVLLAAGLSGCGDTPKPAPKTTVPDPEGNVIPKPAGKGG